MRILSLLIAVVAASATAAPAFAGPIFLESNEIPNICGLEVSVGPDAPASPVQQFGDIEPPWRQEFDSDKICYRVSNPPEACTGSWTEWRCCESSGGESLCSVY